MARTGASRNPPPAREADAPARLPGKAARGAVAMDPPAHGAPGIRELLRRLENYAEADI